MIEMKVLCTVAIYLVNKYYFLYNLGFALILFSRQSNIQSELLHRKSSPGELYCCTFNLLLYCRNTSA